MPDETRRRAGADGPAPLVTAALASVAAVWQRAALPQEGWDRLAGISSPDDIGPLNHAPALARLRERDETAAVFLRLFYLESAESPKALRAILSPAELSFWTRAGLLRRTPGGMRARLRLDMVQGRLILADRRFERPDLRALHLPAGDMVYPPGGDSAILAEVVAELASGRTLDLCCGSGVQGLVAAQRATEVWLTDISARATAMSRVNACLNGADIRTVVGNLFGPLRGEQFDLVIANPPFVPGPKRGPAYHSGGPRGDTVLRRILAGVGAHLRPDGRFVAITHVGLGAGETAATALQATLRSFPGRVLLLVLETGTPIDLAAAQAVFALHRGLAAYAREMYAWLAYLRRQHIEQIAALLIVGERGDRSQVDIVDGGRRVLPIPLSRSPRENVIDWLQAT